MFIFSDGKASPNNFDFKLLRFWPISKKSDLFPYSVVHVHGI